jgi:hypothetical protein
MSHYAKVQNGIVIQVIVADEDFFKIFVDSSPGSWIQTSYNTHGGIHYGADKNPDGGVPLRANYAGIGYLYNEKNDVFYAPRPIDRNGVICDSWTISEPTWLWQPPTPAPVDGKQYSWDETTKSWVEIPLL